MKTQGANKDVVFLSGVRTGFGAFGGSLKDLSAIDLGAAASRHALQRSGVPASDVGHVVFGNALQTSADAIYMARVAATSMIFVPCEGGISHNEIENATPEDLAAGCDVLLNVMLERARVVHGSEAGA